MAGWLAGQTRLAAVARGLLYGSAAEAALKIEETTSLFATAYSAADLRHGPITVAATGLPVLAFAHPGPAAADVAELARDLSHRGADVRLAVNRDELDSMTSERWATAIASRIPGATGEE